MNIGIDTFGCDSGQSGIGTYLLSLIKNLPENSPHSFTLFGRETDRFIYNSETAFVSFLGVNAGSSVFKERLWHSFQIKSFAKKSNFDVVLFPSGARMFPVFKKKPSVLVVNDILSNLSTYANNFIYRNLFRNSLKSAKKIIAASQFIRKNLISFGIAPEKIEVIHNGIDHTYFYPRVLNFDETVLIKPFSIKRPYLIYASRIHYPAKKHIELLRAFALFKKNTGLPHRLVLAGADGPNAHKVHQEAARSPYASDIVLTGFFPRAGFPELYSAAEACIFPSINEGVGLPVIEAMATGIPVACAKAGALPEVAGDNALFFNPDDIENFAKTIETMVSDQPLRQKLIQSGFDWTRRFSWEKTAQKTIEVLEQAVREK